MQNYLTPNFAFAPMIPERASGSRVGIRKGVNILIFQAASPLTLWGTATLPLSML